MRTLTPQSPARRRFSALFSASALVLAAALLAACPDDDETVPPDADADVTDDIDVVEDPDIPTDVDEDTTDPIDDATDVVDDTDPAVDVDADPDPTDVPVDVADVADVPDVDMGAGDEVFCRTLATPTDRTCDVTAGNDRLLIRGTILGGDLFIGGEVLLDAAGEITCVGCDCEAEAAGATVLSCGENVVSPGLINTHDHISFTQNHPADWGDERFNHRHDWRLGIRGHNRISASGSANTQQVTWGEMRQVMSGTTAISGHLTNANVAGFLRNLDQERQESLDKHEVQTHTFPLGLSATDFRSQDCSYDTLPFANRLNLPAYSPHVAEGIDAEARNEARCLMSEERGGVNVTGPTGAFVHMMTLSPIDGAELARRGTTVVWSPRSNISLYGMTAPVTMLHTQGVRIALSTDWTPSGSVNMLRELQCADYLNTVHYDSFFSDRELWAMATIDAARAFHMSDAIGILAPGRQGDIAIYAAGGADNPYRSVLEAGVDDVGLVLRGGLVQYGDADLVASLPGGDGCELIDMVDGSVCGVDKRICAERETGMTLQSLATANSSAYGLFFCDVPDGEPTCVPSRPGEYDGIPTDDDWDGDGISNHLDNCPTIFNPPMPADRGLQADFDGDGIGDACDPCPRDPDTGECSVFDPDDRDGDGTPDGEDLCPNHFNPDQDPSDACELCPEHSAFMGEPCLIPISDIKQRYVPTYTEAVVQGVVTARRANGFFMQMPEDARDPELGARYSGIFVFIPADNPEDLTLPEMADLIELSGEIRNFRDTIQMSWVSELDILEVGEPLPQPEVISPDEVIFGSVRARALEGVLVEVTGEVTAEQDDGTLVLDDHLLVDDFLYEREAQPMIGDVMSLRGVFRLESGASRVSPRGPDDILFISGEPRLAAVEPALAFLEVGENPGASPEETHPAIVVRLDRDAPEDTEISVTSADEDVVTVESPLTVPEGQREVTILATPQVAHDEPVTITVSLPRLVSPPDEAEVAIRVVAIDRQPQVERIVPETTTIFLGQEVTLRVELDLPVGEDDLPIDIQVDDPDNAVQVLGPPDLVKWATSGEILVEGIAEGVATITASAGGGEATATVTVVDEPDFVEIAFFNFDGESPTPTRHADHLTVSDVTHARGSTRYFSGNPGDAIATTEWHENDNYFEFTITPDPGRQFGLTDFSFDHRRSDTGPPNWELLIIVDDDPPLVVGSGTSGTSFQTGSVVIDEPYQGPYSETVRVRIAGFDATGSGGTWRIDNVELLGYVL